VICTICRVFGFGIADPGVPYRFYRRRGVEMRAKLLGTAIVVALAGLCSAVAQVPAKVYHA